MRGKDPSVESHFSLRSLFRSALIIPLIGAFLVTLAGCSDNPVGSGGDRGEEPQKRPNTFQVEGTVGQQQIDGKQVWVIESVDGQSYLPVNFKTGTLKEGLRIRAEVEPLNPQLIEERRGEIDRGLPEEEIIDATSARLVQIRSIGVLREEA